MQRLPHEELRAWLSNDSDRAPDNKTLTKLRKDAANEFRRQLTIGNPTDNDEAGLRRLVKQLKEGRLRVKLFLKHTLHAKLYLAHRDDSINPIIAYLGSSNLTMAGLKGQGELNIDVLDKDAAKKLSDWFVARWEDSRCLDITDELVEIYALENGLPLPIGQQDAALLDTRLHDFGDDELDLDDGDEPLPPLGLWDESHYRSQAAAIYQSISSLKTKRYKWLRTDVFKKTLLRDLKSDTASLQGLLTDTGEIPTTADHKLQALIKLLKHDHSTEKFILFTQFADTAKYLAAALTDAGLKDVDCATGDSEDPAKQAWKFSPESNDKLKQFPPGHQTRILIATDVLSEGQNLQDSARVINYDLPWAIIRLIQRAGRVDRIGQKAEEIHCYSFLPAEGVEQIIKIRKRLVHRLRENEEVVGSDESFFEDQTALDEEALRNLYDEKSGILDEPEDDEVDLTSEAFEVWSQATKNDKALREAIEKIPDVVYATKAHVPNPEHPAQTPLGVLSYIRTPQDHDALLWIDSEGKTVTESLVRIFRQAKCTPETPALPRRADHHELVARSVKIVQDERTITKSGQLGSPRGVRYRSYQMLDDYLRHREGDLFLTDKVRAAIQAIYDFPLTTEAADKLNRQLRSGITADDLANLVTTLHRDDRLVVANLHDAPSKEPHILCSIGLA